MDTTDKTILVIGGEGLVGSHVLEELLVTSFGRAFIYDNFTRGEHAHLDTSLEDPRDGKNL